jgi:eukaryotic-like serine/threonine-protein kinase
MSIRLYRVVLSGSRTTRASAPRITVLQRLMAGSAIMNTRRASSNRHACSAAAIRSTYMSLGRLNEAKATLQEGLGRNPQHVSLRQRMYLLGFMENDQKLQHEQTEWASHETGALARFGLYETEAYFGHARNARELLRAAAESAMHNDLRERAALLWANEALWDAEFGFRETARVRAREALASEPGPDTEVLALEVLAECGDGTRARERVNRLKGDFPLSTLIENYWIPTILAEVEIASNHSDKAIELLRRTEPYDLSSESPMIPVYVRGNAYLKANRGQAAAAEFQKILDHRGIVGISPIGPLARLGLARALAMSGSIAQARDEYQKFITLWKNADEDVPILSEARSEFTRIADAQNQR